MADAHNWLQPVVDAVVGHALRTGRFEHVNRQEALGTTPPGHGIYAEVWAGPGRTIRHSGIAVTSVVQVVMIRLRCPALGEGRDDIDPHMIAALSHLLSSYHTDLTLGGLCRQIDIMGAYWPQGLRWDSGWTSPTVRAYTIWLPLVLDDLWQQQIQDQEG